jgi:curved DNA-binding protein
MGNRDYYQTLGVDRSSTTDDIKKAYRRLARRHHPDVNPGDMAAEEQFKEINAAFQVLSDSEKRRQYDQFGQQWQQTATPSGTSSGSGAEYTRTMSPEEFEEIYGSNLDGMDFFETLFGGRPGGQEQCQPRPRKGRDEEHTVEISLEEAFHGTSRSLQWDDGRRIEARIPRGVRSGSRVRLAGQGGAGLAGGSPGDLYLRVRVTPHAIFLRAGDDLRVSIWVDLYTAVLGGAVTVPTCEQAVSLTIPAETPNGKVFRLRGLGMPLSKDPTQRGDLYARVQVELPLTLNSRERELFQQLRDMRT